MGTYYSIEFNNLWMGVKETAFRTNAQGLDTTNAVDSAFRRFPIKWVGAIAPQPLRYKIEKKRSAGKGLDYSNIYRNGYEAIKFTLTGEVLDFAFLYQLCGGCTTEASYTHTYVTSTAPVTPTFQMLQKVVNITSAESKYILYLGCKITSFVCSYSEETGRIIGMLVIECAKTIAGTALTAEPTWLTTIPYYFNPLTHFVWTGYTGPHTYAGYCAAWNLRYDNGQSLRQANYLLTPDMVLSNFRTIELEWTWVTEELDDFDDSQRDPITDLDQNLVHTLTNGSDTFAMTWAKMAVEHLGEAYEYKEFYLARKYKACLNPNLTSPLTSTLRLVETNGLTNAFYEG